MFSDYLTGTVTRCGTLTSRKEADWPPGPITRLPDYQITQSPDHQIAYNHRVIVTFLSV
jgi:hypothetical protein